MRIRMLTHVAGELAPGVPSPGYGSVVDVDQDVAEVWADGERAELVPDDEPGSVEEQIAQLHDDATTWTDAVVTQVHAEAAEYLAAVQAQAEARIAELEKQIAELKRPTPKKNGQ